MSEEKELKRELSEKLKNKQFSNCLPSVLFDVFGRNLKNNKSGFMARLSPGNEFDGYYPHTSGKMPQLEINKDNLPIIMSMIEDSKHYALRPSAKIYTNYGVVPVQPEISCWYKTKIEDPDQLFDPDFAHNLAAPNFKPSFASPSSEQVLWTPFSEQIENAELNIKRSSDPGHVRKLGILLDINKCFLKSALQIANEK